MMKEKGHKANGLVAGVGAAPPEEPPVRCDCIISLSEGEGRCWALNGFDSWLGAAVMAVTNGLTAERAQSGPVGGCTHLAWSGQRAGPSGCPG